MESEDENESIPALVEAGFFAAIYQRVNIHINARQNGNDNWPRYWMVREVPGGTISTAESRREGMQILKSFFMDSRFTKYPPQSIEISDQTLPQPMPMQHYFLDRDIIRVLEHVVDPEVFNSNFFRNFPECAALAFPGPIFPNEAVTALGFGTPNPHNGPHGAYAPNFVPGPQNNRPSINVGNNEEEKSHNSDDDEQEVEN